MYVPGHFAAPSLERITRFVDEHPLATLVVADSGRLEAHHLPFMRLDRFEVGRTLVAHAARGNPLWRLAEARAEVLLVFSGADAYVSPSYYPGKDEHHKVVPTYNYVAVHVRGELSCAHDKETKLRAVELLTGRMEAGRARPWAVADAPASYVDRMLDGIVALSLEVRAIEAKFKASQNRPEADRRGVIAGLRGEHRATPGQEAAALIEESLGDR